MRVPNSEHTSRPWRVHEITQGFRLEDVWALPTPGGPDDFPRLVEMIADSDPTKASPVAAALFKVRAILGERLGWDDPRAGASPGGATPSLRQRLPADLRDGPTGPEPTLLPFQPLYLLEREWAAELANKTVHGLLHLSWVPDGEGGYRGHMAVYVKPNGLLGQVYLAAIRPFRYTLVYPALMRRAGRQWQQRTGAARSEPRS